RRVAREARDGRREGHVLLWLATHSSHPGEEARFLREALEAYRQGEDAHNEALTLQRLGDLAPTLEERREFYESAASLFADGDACIVGKGQIEEAAGKLATSEGDFQASESHLRQAEVI